jgi:two-component system response regulator RegA
MNFDYLIVDDDTDFLSMLEKVLVRSGNSVLSCSTIAETLKHIPNIHFSRAIIDLRLGDKDSGLSLIQPILERNSSARIIVLTGHGNIASAVDAMRLGAYNYLSKPAELNAILNAFESVPQVVQTEVASLDAIENEHIQRVLRECGGNISRAAKLLGLHRRTLQRKLNRIDSSPNANPLLLK